MQVRTDIHRPSEIDPANYSYTTSFDTQPPQVAPPTGVVTPEFQEYVQGLIQGWLDQRDEIRAMVENDTSVYRSIYRCDHCGAHLRYVSLFLYEPTGEHIAVGEECAENTMSVPDRMSLDMKRLRDKAAAQRENMRQAQETQKRMVITRAEYPQATEILENYEGENSFIKDVQERYMKWGNLSEKQADAIVQAHKRDNAPKEVEEETAPVVEGKITVTGEVKKAYVKETDFGSRFVMIVQDDRGFKVWGTVPSSLQEIPSSIKMEGSEDVLYRGLEEGDRVSFNANVTKSDRDESFGFFKRPSKAKYLGE